MCFFLYQTIALLGKGRPYFLEVNGVCDIVTMDENLCIKSMYIDFSHIWNELDGKENYYLTLLLILL